MRSSSRTGVSFAFAMSFALSCRLSSPPSAREAGSAVPVAPAASSAAPPADLDHLHVVPAVRRIGMVVGSRKPGGGSELVEVAERADRGRVVHVARLAQDGAREEEEEETEPIEGADFDGVWAIVESAHLTRFAPADATHGQSAMDGAGMTLFVQDPGSGWHVARWSDPGAPQPGADAAWAKLGRLARARASRVRLSSFGSE